MTNDRSTVLLCEGALGDFGRSKTAYGILRFAASGVAAVIDSTHAGKDCAEVTGLGQGIPVVANLEQALNFEPSRLVIGVATVGGVLPQTMREVVLRALERGLEVHNGLHEMLAADKELAGAAMRGGGRIVDLRAVPDALPCAELRAQQVDAFVVLTVGTDCNTGKMTAALEVAAEARRRGIETAFCATGQTGIAIEGHGIAVDHVISDFTAGAAERLVVEAGRGESVELILVEGQGGLAQPVYSGVTLSLMHGSLPDAMILCHRAGQDRLEIVNTPMPSLADQVALYEHAMQPVKPAKVAAVAVNTRGLEETEARRALERAAGETGLPAADPSRFGAAPIMDALLDAGMRKVSLRGV